MEEGGNGAPGLRGARIDDGKGDRTLPPKQSLVVASGAAARSADLELSFQVPAASQNQPQMAHRAKCL